MEKNKKELLSDIELWIAFLERHSEAELLKQARMTKMKLSLLIEEEEKNGSLDQNQEYILSICHRDYKYIEEGIFRLKYEPKNTLH